ncbi:hypothetical protein F4805DRAFT_324393 [Annulohypoxylon moriforme]|nr:hypothetical protein F4805DRAFT_324393 [Annulohypoxylon moriforme]
MMFQVTSNFVVLALFASAAHSLTYVGCFSSSTNLVFNSRSPFQSVGLCLQNCNGANMPILGVTNGTDCLCGTSAPPQDSSAAESSCNEPCGGYPQDKCGGEGFFSVHSIPDPTPKRDVEAAPEVAIPGEAPIGGSGLPL